MLLKAALFGEVDPVTGVSANIMMGQPIRGGTSFSQIMLDEQILPKLFEGLEEAPEIDNEEETQDVDEILTDDTVNPCSTKHIQGGMVMPTQIQSIMDEDDVELEVM
jgi:hypothetical protein